MIPEYSGSGELHEMVELLAALPLTAANRWCTTG